MKKFQKLSRTEMKEVNGGKFYPACYTGRTCFTVPNGVCDGSLGLECFCTSTTGQGYSVDPYCSGQNQ